MTVGNLVYDNVISDSEIGIRATRSHNNIVENTTFSDIESSEYRLLGDSSLIIGRQHFDNVMISGDDSVTGNLVEIVGSGTIEVTEGERDEDEDDSGDEDGDDDGEGHSYNTDIEPFRKTLSDGDNITVNSS
jgi:parallel beta-helix repeat protein